MDRHTDEVLKFDSHLRCCICGREKSQITLKTISPLFSTPKKHHTSKVCVTCLSRDIKASQAKTKALQIVQQLPPVTVTLTQSASTSASTGNCPGVKTPLEWLPLLLFELTCLVHPDSDSSRPAMGMFRPHAVSY